MPAGDARAAGWNRRVLRDRTGTTILSARPLVCPIWIMNPSIHYLYRQLCPSSRLCSMSDPGQLVNPVPLEVRVACSSFSSAYIVQDDKNVRSLETAGCVKGRVGTRFVMVLWLQGASWRGSSWRASRPGTTRLPNLYGDLTDIRKSRQKFVACAGGSQDIART